MVYHFIPSTLFHRVFLVAAVVCLLLFSSCSSPPTPEEQIHQFIDTAEEAVEDGKIRKIYPLVSDTYDDGKRNKRELMNYLVYQVLRNKSVYLFTSVSSIEFSKEDTALVEVITGMTGAPAESKFELLNLQAQVYSFSLTLSREDEEWRLISASWQPAELTDLIQ